MTTIISGDTGISPVTASGTSASVDGMTVGRGGGEVATNTAVGASALVANTSGAYNVAVGAEALPANTTGSDNTSVGRRSGQSNTTGSQNTMLGVQAMALNTTGGSNTAVGVSALQSNTTASNSTAVGYQAGYSQTTSPDNVFMGNKAGYSTSTGSGSNTFIGQQAGYSHTTGQNNQFFGGGAGYYISTGSKNTVIGAYTGNQGGLDIRTSSSNIVLSDGDGNPRGYFNTDVGGWRFNNGGTANSVVAEFVNASASSPYGVAFNFSAATPNNTTNYFLYCYDSTNVKAIIYSNGSFQSRANSYGGISDIKLKQDIIDATSQWNDVKAFQIKKYRFKDDPTGGLQLGVIAQELEQTSPNLVYESPDFITNESGEREELGTTTKAVKYSILYMKAVKALQEAMIRIEQLETDVAALKGN